MIVASSFSVLPYARVKLPNRREQDKTVKSHGEKDEVIRLRVNMMKLHMSRFHGWPRQTDYGVPYNPIAIKLFNATVQIQNLFK